LLWGVNLLRGVNLLWGVARGKKKKYIKELEIKKDISF